MRIFFTVSQEELYSERQRTESASLYKIKFKNQIIPIEIEESYFQSQYNMSP